MSARGTPTHAPCANNLCQFAPISHVCRQPNFPGDPMPSGSGATFSLFLVRARVHIFLIKRTKSRRVVLIDTQKGRDPHLFRGALSSSHQLAPVRREAARDLLLNTLRGEFQNIPHGRCKSTSAPFTESECVCVWYRHYRKIRPSFP